ncbi:MAG: hypothetical protein V1804_04290 [Patescibacteria group bacterium]
MIFGTGVFIVMIVQWLIKRNFDQWEFISLALLGGMLIAPAILSTEFILFKKAYDWYPIANSIVLWLGAGFLLYCKKTSFPKISFPTKRIIRHPLFIVFMFGFFFTVAQVLMYPALPDLDPYKWLLKYTYQFSSQLLDYVERPLFGSLIFVGTRFTGVSIITFFKYILPFLFLLTLFPAWMIARTFQNTRKQWIWLLFTFTSPVIILYAQTAMPQSILIILSYFIVFFLLYSDQKKDDFFLYSAGILALLSFFFHQAGSIIFAVWVIIMIVLKRSSIFLNKKNLLLFLLLLALAFHYFKGIYNFVSSWTLMVYSRIFSPDNLNLFFPAQYSNIDSKSMGWNSLTGVIQFYAFHVGPLIIALLFVFLIMLFSNKKFRSFTLSNATHPALFIAGTIFFLFFTVAEILPRFPNIALLPDRAWIFAGIFTFLILYIILRFLKNIPSWVMLFFMLFFITGISGALYINYLKRYLLTPAQIKSAEWIKKKLPENRLFISYGHKLLLPFYADTPLLGITSSVYCSDNIQDFYDILNSMDENTLNQSTLKNYEIFLQDSAKIIKNAALNYEKIDANDKNSKLVGANAIIDTMINTAAQLKAAINKKIDIKIVPPLSTIININKPIMAESTYNQKNITFNDFMESSLYIYYARESSLNPYYSRPYEITTWGIKPCPEGKLLFDLYPDKFKRIYYTKDEEIIIWKVLLTPKQTLSANK